MKALFLGAGASYEVGMPLVWEFTETLRTNVLKRIDTNLFNLKGNTQLKNTLIKILNNNKLHYEQIVAELENLYLNTSPRSQDINHAITQLIECIQLLLLEEQMNISKLMKERIKDYYGLKSFIEKDNPTHIFSLNHDVVFEEICSYHNIPMKNGFYEDSRKYGHIVPFSSISIEQLQQGKLNFFKHNEYGVNLIKLHGSLDIFGVEDMKYFLKVKNTDQSVGSYINSIINLEKQNHQIIARDGVRTTNELCVEDSDGEIQFLRRSLLSGGNKFKGNISQIAPVAFLHEFYKRIFEVDELTIIGYGFGDNHINDIFIDWLERKSNKMIIYDPYLQNIPKPLGNHREKINIINGGFTDFCLFFDSSKETILNKVKRNCLNSVRENLKNRRINTQEKP